MTDLERLWQLQGLDAELARLRRQRDEHPTWLALQEHRRRLAELEGQLRQCAGAVEQLRRQVRQGEREVQAGHQEVRQLEERLFGGTVTHPKELAGLQQRLERLRAGLQQLEEKVLEQMLALEEQQTRWQALQEQHRSLSGTLADLEQKWQVTETELAQQEAQLVQRRQELVGSFSDGVWLQRYQRLYEAKGGRPVARVLEGRCEGCGVPVPTLLQEALRKPQRPVVCEVCGRILWLA